MTLRNSFPTSTAYESNETEIRHGDAERKKENNNKRGEMRHSSNHVNHGIRNIGRKMRNRFLFITREFNFRHVSEGFEKRNLPSIIQFGWSPLHHMTSL